MFIKGDNEVTLSEPTVVALIEDWLARCFDGHDQTYRRDSIEIINVTVETLAETKVLGSMCIRFKPRGAGTP